jgi:hypothetical protein
MVTSEWATTRPQWRKVLAELDERIGLYATVEIWSRKICRRLADFFLLATVMSFAVP